MLLFIDRLPLFTWYPSGSSNSITSITLPILPSYSHPASRPRTMPPQRWLYDTGCTSEGFLLRPFLEDAGIDPDRFPGPQKPLITADGARLSRPTTRVKLWLYSNIPELASDPYPLYVSPSLPFQDAPLPTHIDANYFLPLLGLAPVLRAGLDIRIDRGGDTISVWVPEQGKSRLARIAHWLRRAATGFGTRDPWK